MAEHTLVRDGWPHWLNGRGQRGQQMVPYFDGEGPGRAACSCTWLSDPLPTTQARRAAWAQHVTDTKESPRA